MLPIIVENANEFRALVRDVYEQMTQRVSFAKQSATDFNFRYYIDY